MDPQHLNSLNSGSKGQLIIDGASLQISRVMSYHSILCNLNIDETTFVFGKRNNLKHKIKLSHLYWKNLKISDVINYFVMYAPQLILIDHLLSLL